MVVWGVPYLLAFVSGAAFSLALPAYSFWPLLLAFVPLMVLTARAERLKQAFFLGFSFAIAFFGVHLLWLPLSFTELFGPVAWVIYPPLLVILGIMWGSASYLSRWLGGYGLGTLWLLPAFWVLLEWLRAQGSLAFPWGFVGYGWLGTPLAQVADMSGVYGLSLLSLVVLALVSSLFVPRPHSTGLASSALPLGLAVLLLGGMYGYGSYRLLEGLPERTQRVLLVQGNTNPLYRLNGAEDDLARHARLTASAIAELEDTASLPDVVIWPEGAVLWQDLSRIDLPDTLEAIAIIQGSAAGRPVITGGGAYVGNQGYNSAFSLVNEQVIDRYDKTYLVPFGESFPFQRVLAPLYRTVFGWFGLGYLQSRLPGTEIRPVLSAGFLAGVYICYESVFPQVPRRMVAEGAQVLSNISNDAWYGEGLGAVQHFAMGSLRAIETRRYILRAGNDGITAVIDPYGRALEALPRGVEDTLVAPFNLRYDQSPYVRFGDWLIIALASYVLLYTAARAWLRGVA